MNHKTARLFRIGRSQAVRLTKEFRFKGDTILIRREGSAVILEPPQTWPEGYVDSFAGMPEDFVRPSQGGIEKRRTASRK